MTFIFRHFRFSLRTLFVCSLLLAIAAAWFGLELRARQRQRVAVNAILECGGVVWYDAFHHTTEVEFIVHPGKACGQTRGLGSVRRNQQVTFSERDIFHFKNLRRLERVDFTGSQVAAADIEDFRRAHPSLHVKP